MGTPFFSCNLLSTVEASGSYRVPDTMSRRKRLGPFFLGNKSDRSDRNTLSSNPLAKLHTHSYSSERVDNSTATGFLRVRKYLLIIAEIAACFISSRLIEACRNRALLVLMIYELYPTE